jgi:hypothetical protein
MSNVQKVSVLPVSAAQREIWLSEKIAPGSRFQNVAQCLEILGSVDPAIFEQSLQRLMLEAEAWCVRFVEDDNGPQQVIAPPPEKLASFFDFSSEASPTVAAENWMQSNLLQPVDLTKDQLFAFALLQVAPQRFFCYMRCHHIIGDGYTGLLLAQRLADIYTALASGVVPPAGNFGSLRLLVQSDLE